MTKPSFVYYFSKTRLFSSCFETIFTFFHFDFFFSKDNVVKRISSFLKLYSNFTKQRKIFTKLCFRKLKQRDRILKQRNRKLE